ncbi:MAG: putative cytokinetic ring protein SteA [Nocardioides sp.]
MKLRTRTDLPTLPGLAGTLRVGRPTRSLLARLRPGDIAVVDHVDLDRATAQRMLDAGVVAVINAQPISSGRFPNQGPQLLVDAGILLVDSVGEGGFGALGDGRAARIVDGIVYDGEQRLTTGRVVDKAVIETQMAEARTGMASQLQTLTHTSTELIRREEDVILHGVGLPVLDARIRDRTVLVVADSGQTAAQLRGMRSFLREQRPTVVATAPAVAAVRAAGLRADVIVVGAGEDLPDAKSLRGARDVVLCGTGTTHDDGLARLGTAPHRVLSSLGSREIAVLSAHVADPRVMIGVGLGAGLADALDRDRDGAAGAYLSRLAAGPRLVDASAVPTLYSGKVRVHHIVLALLICLVAVTAAIATTDVGHDWLRDALDRIGVAR